MAEIYKQEINDLFQTATDPVKPMWIEEDGNIHGITLRAANYEDDLKKAFDLGI